MGEAAALDGIVPNGAQTIDPSHEGSGGLRDEALEAWTRIDKDTGHIRARRVLGTLYQRARAVTFDGLDFGSAKSDVLVFGSSPLRTPKPLAGLDHSC